MSYCPACGAEVRERASFCMACGTCLSRPESNGVVESDAEDSSHAPAQPPPKANEPPPERSTAAETVSPSDEGWSFKGHFWINSIIGTAVGFVLAAMISTVFFPIYFVGIFAGGTVGALLQDRGSSSGAMVGAMVGVLSTIPFIVAVIAILVVGSGWLATSAVPADPNAVGDVIRGFGVLGGLISLVALAVNASVFG